MNDLLSRQPSLSEVLARPNREQFDPDRIPAGLTDSAAIERVAWPYAWRVTAPVISPESV